MDKKRLELSVCLSESASDIPHPFLRSLPHRLIQLYTFRRRCRLGSVLWKRHDVFERVEIGTTLYRLRY